MSGIIIDVIFLLIILIFGIVGYSKGFLRSVLSLIGFAASILIAYIFADYFATILNNLFGWGDTIRHFVAKQVENLSSSFVLESRTSVEGLVEVINSSGVSIIFKLLFPKIIEGADFSQGALTVADVISVKASALAMNIIAMAILFVLLRIVVAILNRILKTIPEKSVVGEINKWLGFIFGLARGLIVGCLILVITYILCMIPAVNSVVYPYISNSAITSFVYQKIGELILTYF